MDTDVFDALGIEPHIVNGAGAGSDPHHVLVPAAASDAPPVDMDRPVAAPLQYSFRQRISISITKRMHDCRDSGQVPPPRREPVMPAPTAWRVVHHRVAQVAKPTLTVSGHRPDRSRFTMRFAASR